jgi:hypothetical protein
MKKIITILIIASVLLSPSSAQLTRGGAAFVKLGYARLDGSGSVFDKIAPAGVSPFSNNAAAFGAEGYYRINKLILGLDGNIGVHGVKLTDSKAAEALSGAAYARFGRIIKENKNYWLYPSIGIGTGAIALKTYARVNTGTSYEKINYLLSPSLDFGMNADFGLVRAQIDGKYNYLILGLRAGYRVSRSTDNWHGAKYDKLTITPSYGYHGFYIMASIGIGEFSDN